MHLTIFLKVILSLGVCNTMTIEDCFAISTIWMEARGESKAGKIAVARVIKNRTERRYQSNGNVVGTCLKPFQFSAWNHKDPNRMALAEAMNSQRGKKQIEEIQEIWEQVKEEDSDFPAVLYHTTQVSPKWSKSKLVTKIGQIGNHIFYDEEG